MQIEKQARIFKALSNPHRLAIYLRLINCCAPGSLCSTDASDTNNCVGEVASGLNLAASTVSHHLKELRQAGLIKMEKQGQKNLCHVDPEVLEQLVTFLGDQMTRPGNKPTKVRV